MGDTPDRLDPIPPRIREVFGDLDNEVVWLHARWKLYRQLFGTSAGRIELLNDTAAFFFRNIQDVLRDDVILGLSRLLDNRRDSVGLRSIRKGLESGKSLDLEARLDSILAQLQAHAANFMTIRHERLAHRSTKVSQDGERVLPGVSRADVEQVLECVRDFMNAVWLHFADSQTVYQEVGSYRSSDALILALQKAFAYDEAVRQGLIPRLMWQETKHGRA